MEKRGFIMIGSIFPVCQFFSGTQPTAHFHGGRRIGQHSALPLILGYSVVEWALIAQCFSGLVSFAFSLWS
jgi:hypothetical protein